jgi:TPR repeat protein
MYDNGEGVPENNSEAVKWYRRAAEQGNATAQNNIGVMYDEGKGVIQNNVIAHMLFNLAGSQGLEIGRDDRDLIAERMTPSDISRAQEMAATCLEKNYKGCGF